MNLRSRDTSRRPSNSVEPASSSGPTSRRPSHGDGSSFLFQSASSRRPSNQNNHLLGSKSNYQLKHLSATGEELSISMDAADVHDNYLLGSFSQDPEDDFQFYSQGIYQTTSNDSTLFGEVSERIMQQHLSLTHGGGLNVRQPMAALGPTMTSLTLSGSLDYQQQPPSGAGAYLTPAMDGRIAAPAAALSRKNSAVPPATVVAKQSQSNVLAAPTGLAGPADRLVAEKKKQRRREQLLQAREAQYRAFLQQLPLTKTCFGAYDELLFHWAHAKGHVVDAAGGLCVLVSLPYLQQVKIHFEPVRTLAQAAKETVARWCRGLGLCAPTGDAVVLAPKRSDAGFADAAAAEPPAPALTTTLSGHVYASSYDDGDDSVVYVDPARLRTARDAPRRHRRRRGASKAAKASSKKAAAEAERQQRAQADAEAAERALLALDVDAALVSQRMRLVIDAVRTPRLLPSGQPDPLDTALNGEYHGEFVLDFRLPPSWLRWYFRRSRRQRREAWTALMHRRCLSHRYNKHTGLLVVYVDDVRLRRDADGDGDRRVDRAPSSPQPSPSFRPLPPTVYSPGGYVVQPPAAAPPATTATATTATAAAEAPPAALQTHLSTSADSAGLVEADDALRAKRLERWTGPALDGGAAPRDADDAETIEHKRLVPLRQPSPTAAPPVAARPPLSPAASASATAAHSPLLKKSLRNVAKSRDAAAVAAAMATAERPSDGDDDDDAPGVSAASLADFDGATTMFRAVRSYRAPPSTLDVSSSSGDGGADGGGRSASEASSPGGSPVITRKVSAQRLSRRPPPPP
eukprot:gene8596-6188_t